MAKVGRNEPCPCGSGKKYKRCHEGKTDDPAAVSAVEAPELQAPAPMPAWTKWVPYAGGVIGGSIAVYLVMTGNNRGAAAVCGATGLLVAGWFLFTNPPPPRGDGADPAGRNFGRNQD